MLTGESSRPSLPLPFLVIIGVGGGFRVAGVRTDERRGISISEYFRDIERFYQVRFFPTVTTVGGRKCARLIPS